jgi:hypothetical protein
MMVFYPTACHYSSNIEQFVRITWVTAGRFVGNSVVFSGFVRIHHECTMNVPFLMGSALCLCARFTTFQATIRMDVGGSRWSDILLLCRRFDKSVELP